MIFHLLCFLFLLKLIQSKVDLSKNDYGVDCSYPINHGINQKECPYWYDRYEEMMKKCYKYWSEEDCKRNERDRLRHSLSQPRTQHNYTELGFKKIKVPDHIWKSIQDFYQSHKHESTPEKWYQGATIVNIWDSPTRMISFEDSRFSDGLKTKQYIFDNVEKLVSEWVGRKLRQTSLYGIRLYSNQSILSTHVDRLPLVTSCIINVDQDLEEPWPLEVYDHNGRAHNVTMEPGDLVFYESSTVLHGRPFPMNGKYYANIFVHYEPLDHKELNRIDKDSQHLKEDRIGIKSRHLRLKRSIYASEEKQQVDLKSESDPSFSIRTAAAGGNLGDVKRILLSNPSLIDAEDENGWRAIHEATRAGHADVLRYLIEKGADIKAECNLGTIREVAQQELSENHEIFEVLDQFGI